MDRAAKFGVKPQTRHAFEGPEIVLGISETHHHLIVVSIEPTANYDPTVVSTYS